MAPEVTGTPSAQSGRKVVAHITVSMDGRTAGPQGDLGWLIEHAIYDQTRAHFEGVWRGADSVLLGRINYEGFHGYWPLVAANPDSYPRDRDMAQWLDDVEKVVFSRTLTSVDWPNSRLADREPADEIRELKAAEGRDILVLTSSSLIRELLDAQLVDELHLTVLPVILGDGPRLLIDGMAGSRWELARTAVLAYGAVWLTWTRSA